MDETALAPKTAAELAKDPAALEARRQRAQQEWQRVVDAREARQTLPATAMATIKGGLLVDVGGIRGFLPASQVSPGEAGGLEALVKTTVGVRVLDCDAARRRIVVSQRRAAEDERRAKRTELLEALAVGQMREGTVARLTDFGAFIDLGGIEDRFAGKLATGGEGRRTHRGEDSGGGPAHRGGRKISLAQNALPDPWRDTWALRVGATVNGTIIASRPPIREAPGSEPA